MKGADPKQIQAESISALKALELCKVKRIQDVLAVKINGDLFDLSSVIDADAEIEPIYIATDEDYPSLGTAHLMSWQWPSGSFIPV